MLKAIKILIQEKILDSPANILYFILFLICRTFQPVFNYLRKSTEHISNLYLEDARKLQDLIRDIVKCGETLKEKYKLVSCMGLLSLHY